MKNYPGAKEVCPACAWDKKHSYKPLNKPEILALNRDWNGFYWEPVWWGYAADKECCSPLSEIKSCYLSYYIEHCSPDRYYSTNSGMKEKVIRCSGGTVEIWLELFKMEWKRRDNSLVLTPKEEKKYVQTDGYF